MGEHKSHVDELRAHILRARDGDPDAFDEVVRRFQGVAFRYAYSILSDREAAADATQEAFVQAYRALPSLNEPSAFAGWFKTIVSRCARSRVRGRRVDWVALDAIADTSSQEPSPHEQFEKRELAERVASEIRNLPEQEYAVTKLFYYDRRSQREIAELLSLPVTTVNNRLYSSRRRLKMALSDIAEPVVIATTKEKTMQLKHSKTRCKLLKDDVEVVVRTMKRADIPAMRRLDDEITAATDFANAQRAPGSESYPGGPWSEDEWLAEHFERYSSSGNITLLAEDADGKLVGFVDLWAASEPDPFGPSLDAECIDYLWEYHHLGLETILLEEAEKVARAAGLPALDAGTNTSSGSYPSLRRFGMKVFYEYDELLCRCESLPAADRPDYRVVPPEEVDRSGLLKINHWSPSDFGFAHEPGRPGVHESAVDGHRVVADFWRLWEPGHTAPIACELLAPPEALQSPALMSKILRAAAFLAGEAGAKEIPLPCPSDMPVDESMVTVADRGFKFAWMRKELQS